MNLAKIIFPNLRQYKNISRQIKQEAKRKFSIKSKSVAKRCTSKKKKNNCIVFKIELR